MFYVENNDKNNDVDIKRVKEIIKIFLKYLNEKRNFSVHFISQDDMKNLNKKYRGLDDSTDILTFRFQDGDEFPFSDKNDLGDLFVSYDNLKNNANFYSVEEEEELSRLLLHGLLHLEGYDHKSNDEKIEPMLIKQEEILKKLNFKKTF